MPSHQDINKLMHSTKINVCEIRLTPEWSAINFDHQMYHESDNLMQPLLYNDEFHHCKQIDPITFYWMESLFIPM